MLRLGSTYGDCWGWPGNKFCEPTQVLCDSCERELVLGATWATQPEATKPQNLGPLAASAIYSCGHPRFMFVVRLHLVKRDRDGKRGQASRTLVRGIGGLIISGVPTRFAMLRRPRKR